MSKKWIDNLNEEQKRELEQSYPLGVGKPKDVVNFIDYLLSDKASWLTGQKYILDGGHQVRKA